MPATKSRLAIFRNDFFSGLLLLAPVVVTVWALAKIIELFGGTFWSVFSFLLPKSLNNTPALNLVWDVLATVIIMLLIAVLGRLSRYVFGRYFLGVADRTIQSIPGVNAVYNTVKQIAETFGPKNRHLFSKVVLVQFPRPGVWAVGFLTGPAQGEIKARTTGELWSVFVPTTPNPTGGFLLLLPRSELVELDMSVGDGMKLIISGGVVVPPWNGKHPVPAVK